MMSSLNKIALFTSARCVIKADKACQKIKIKAKVLAVPEALSSECGMCLLIAEDQQEAFLKLMIDERLEITLYNEPLR